MITWMTVLLVFSYRHPHIPLIVVLCRNYCGYFGCLSGFVVCFPPIFFGVAGALSYSSNVGLQGGGLMAFKIS